MVKSVVGEETRLKSVEDRLFQSGIPTEVGLVIGRLSSSLDRGFVFDLVPTPPNDAGEPACSILESGRDDRKKASKGKQQVEASVVLSIDRDWVAEHARQVSRMLLGGMNVVGLYIWAAESSFKTSSTVLWQTVMGIAKAAPFYENNLDERLLIHISYSPRRWTCRNCLLGSSLMSTSLKPCDFKMGKPLSGLQAFRCTYNFEIRIPVLHKESNSSTLREILHDGISCHAKELKAAKALVDGNLVVKDQQIISDTLHEVELLLPFMKEGPAEACSMEEVTGLVFFSGTVYSSAYLCPKEPVSQAISNIEGDIITSLRSRLDIICDEAEVGMVTTSEVGEEAKSEISSEKSTHQLILHGLRKHCSLSLPRRVLVPWFGGIFICDYLQPSETLEDLKGHCKEMMSMELPTDTSRIIDPETDATPSTARSFWDVVSGNSVSNMDYHTVRENAKDSSTEGLCTKTRNNNSNIIFAIAIVVLSILLALGVFVKPVTTVY